MLQWVSQLLLTESRFQRLGPVVNEFLIDVFSCIEDDRLAFHANNQDKIYLVPAQRIYLGNIVFRATSSTEQHQQAVA